jgi:predicted Zn-dependent protease
MKLTVFLIILSITFANSARANIIRDSEIEEAVNLIVNPLKEVAGLPDLKVHIIDNPIPNAFTAGGNDIFVNSGLIIDFPNPDILRGIIAHEIGHILGNHIVRRQEVIDNYTKASIGATALGLATALSGGGAEGLAIAMGATHLAERSVYAYSRTFESSADQTALKLLEQSSHSSVGLIEFFEKMQIFANSNMQNPYEQTHPLSNDRLLILRSFNKRSKFRNSQNHHDLLYKYTRSSAKLAAYTLDLDKIFDHKYEKNAEEITHYMKAIKCFRMGNFDDALNHINHLIMKNPTDPYYHELKGQIYFEAGKSAALTEYLIACEAKPNDVLLTLGKAIIGITLHLNDPHYITTFYKDLLFVLENDPDNLLALHYLAIYYEKKGLVGKSRLNTALIALKSGRIKDARTMAKIAKNELPKNSPDWYKAGDILAATE